AFNKKYCTALLLAKINKHDDIYNYLVEHGANVASLDTYLRKLISHNERLDGYIAQAARFVWYTSYDLAHFSYLIAEDPECIFVQDEQGNNLLHHCAIYQRASMADAIMYTLKADDRVKILNAKNNKGQTPLDMLLEALEKEEG